MAEQGIEQAAKAGHDLANPHVPWKSIPLDVQAHWRKIARAMQPHLARESRGGGTELTTKQLEDGGAAAYERWLKGARSWNEIAAVVAPHVQYSPAEPIASDAQASAHCASEARANPGNEDACCTICGALLVCLSCGNHQAEALKRQGYVPASALGPLTERERQYHVFRDDERHGEITSLLRVNVILADRLKRLTAPEPMKTDPAVDAVRKLMFSTYETHICGRTPEQIVAAVDKARAAEKEAANG